MAHHELKAETQFRDLQYMNYEELRDTCKTHYLAVNGSEHDLFERLWLVVKKKKQEEVTRLQGLARPGDYASNQLFKAIDELRKFELDFSALKEQRDRGLAVEMMARAAETAKVDAEEIHKRYGEMEVVVRNAVAANKRADVERAEKQKARLQEPLKANGNVDMSSKKIPTGVSTPSMSKKVPLNFNEKPRLHNQAAQSLPMRGHPQNVRSDNSRSRHRRRESQQMEAQIHSPSHPSTRVNEKSHGQATQKMDTRNHLPSKPPVSTYSKIGGSQSSQKKATRVQAQDIPSTSINLKPHGHPAQQIAKLIHSLNTPPISAQSKPHIDVQPTQQTSTQTQSPKPSSISNIPKPQSQPTQQVTTTNQAPDTETSKSAKRAASSSPPSKRPIKRLSNHSKGYLQQWGPDSIPIALNGPKDRGEETKQEMDAFLHGRTYVIATVTGQSGRGPEDPMSFMLSIMKALDPEEVRADDARFYVTFQNSWNGDRNALECYKKKHNSVFLGGKLMLELKLRKEASLQIQNEAFELEEKRRLQA